MSAVSEVDINETMRREDDDLCRLVNRWESTYCEYLAASSGREQLSDQIAALEGQILRDRPVTFPGLAAVLGLAHTIISARDADPDDYITDGPATALIARAIEAVRHLDGVLHRD